MITSKEIVDLTGIRGSDINQTIKNLIIKIPICKDWFTEDTYTYNTINNGKKSTFTYNCKLEGVKLFIDNKRKSPKLQPLIDWYNSQINTDTEVIVLNSRFEDSFISQLEQTLEPLGYKLTKQKLVGNNYKIDGYIEELKLAIEYDEEHHFTTTNNLLDKERQAEIENELGCTFVRCDYRDTDAYNVGLVIKEIFKIRR